MGFMWIILIIIIVAAVLLTKGYLSPAKKEGEPPRESALDLLKKRYARGEISKQEFEERKKKFNLAHGGNHGTGKKICL